VHVGRQGLLRDAASLLRRPLVLLRIGLLLLHLLQQHAGVLRHQCVSEADSDIRETVKQNPRH